MAKLSLIRNPAPTDPAAVELRGRLDEFYSNTTTYSAFSETHEAENDQAAFHELMLPTISNMAARGRKVRVLELGAGRPTLPKNLGDLRSRIEYHAQDVTPANREYVTSVTDHFFIGDITQLQGGYDLIFSTFVFEHVASPVSFLTEVKRLLNDGGVHVIFCPRYDLPGYICPSLRHLNRAGRAWATTFLTCSRLLARLDGQPRFWINNDPSLFHGPWYRDADAVHLVSRYDVEQWHRKNGYEVQRLYPKFAGLRDWVLKRQLTLSLQCRKIGANR